MKVWNIIKKILGILEGAMIIAVLSCFFLLRFDGLDNFIVLSGSMQPTLNVDDLIFVQRISIDEVNESDIITFKEGNSFVTHRAIDIVRENDKVTEITTKGDYNNTPDKAKVTSENFYGKISYSIPKCGTVLNFIQSPLGIVLIIGVPVMTIMLSSIIDYANRMYEESKKKRINIRR